MTDLLANPDCKLCHGTGTIRERRPDYWGMPAYERIICDCYEPEEENAAMRPVGLGKHIECSCGWTGTQADLIAEWSDIEPHCPECWNSRDFIDETEKEKKCQGQSKP